MRNVFYDDKNCNFHVCVDYIIDSRKEPEIKGIEFEQYFNEQNNRVNNICVMWQIYLVKANFSSDHFNPDDKMYYEPYIYNFINGQGKPYNELDSIYYEENFFVKLVTKELSKIEVPQNDEIGPFDYSKMIVKILNDNYGRMSIIDLYKTIWYEYQKEQVLKEDSDRAYLWQYYVGNEIDKLREDGIIQDKISTPKGIIQIAKNICSDEE